MSTYRDNANPPTEEEDTEVVQFRDEEERRFWDACVASISGASDCKSTATAVSWSDRLIRDRRQRSLAVVAKMKKEEA